MLPAQEAVETLVQLINQPTVINITPYSHSVADWLFSRLNCASLLSRIHNLGYSSLSLKPMQCRWVAGKD
jgi:hypothetical protein